MDREYIGDLAFIDYYAHGFPLLSVYEDGHWISQGGVAGELQVRNYFWVQVLRQKAQEKQQRQEREKREADATRKAEYESQSSETYRLNKVVDRLEKVTLNLESKTKRSTKRRQKK
jgi:hypothetical protein